MTRVRIIGGGLTGILAAFEAHRLGAGEITIEDALDRPGGWRLPLMRDGVELCDGDVLFSAGPDPIRETLAWHGVAFDLVERREGAVSPAPGGVRADWSPGPVIAAALAQPPPVLTPPAIDPAAETLTDRLRAWPRAVSEPLAAHCQWRLGVWLDQVHASAAPALGLDDLRLVAPGQTVRPHPRHAAVPREGLGGLFAAAGRALARLGVRIAFHRLVSPREAALSRRSEDVVVWAADPTPLFDLAALPRPRLIGEPVAAYVFRARPAGPLPLTVRNFTARGRVATLRAHERRGETLVALECVAEAADADLAREAARLAGPFLDAPLVLTDLLSANLRTRFACPSVEAVRRLDQLRQALDRDHRGRFVVAGWESADEAGRIAALSARLAQAMGRAPASRAA